MGGDPHHLASRLAGRCTARALFAAGSALAAGSGRGLFAAGGSGGLRGDGGVVGHVVEHHEGALAAEFQHDALEVAPGGVFKEAAAHFGGAGEGHHVHAGVQPERFAHGGAGARDHVEHAFGDARFGGELRELQGGERGDAGGLEDDAVAFGKGGAELPAHHHEREVPRQDAGDHPGGLAHDEPQPAVSGGGDAAVLLVRAFGVPFEALDGFRQIREQAFADGLPAVQRFEDRQLDLMLFDEPMKRMRIFLRSEGCIRDQAPLSKALRAAATALSTSSRPQEATRAISLPVAGLTVGIVSPERAGANVPPIKASVG